ncbi:CsbD family protein [Lactobacillus paragasseri]|nr:CsbD family protein [Lactobacillus paragasseri]
MKDKHGIKDKVAGKFKEVEGKVTGDKARELEGKVKSKATKVKEDLE